VAWAFCFACSGLFFPLVLGVWWKRANRPGALAGMVIGFAAGSFYLYLVNDWDGAAGTVYPMMAPWIGMDNLRFGMVGMAASLVSMVAVTLMTPAPDEETQRMVDEVRIPTGETILAQAH
jgi:cation/acetate symporter